MTDLDVTVTNVISMQFKIPKQMPLTSETEAVQASTQAAGSMTAACTLGTAISQILMSGALSQVWGMINGLQLFVHIPLFRLTLPPNA